MRGRGGFKADARRGLEGSGVDGRVAAPASHNCGSFGNNEGCNGHGSILLCIKSMVQSFALVREKSWYQVPSRKESFMVRRICTAHETLTVSHLWLVGATVPKRQPSLGIRSLAGIIVLRYTGFAHLLRPPGFGLFCRSLAHRDSGCGRGIRPSRAGILECVDVNASYESINRGETSFAGI